MIKLNDEPTLSHCPFCGGEVKWRHYSRQTRNNANKMGEVLPPAIDCLRCKASFQFNSRCAAVYQTDAAKAFNRRSPEAIPLRPKATRDDDLLWGEG